MLREFYDFDNRPFEDSLRALGFTIPATRSNYDFTVVAIPSLLNFSQLTDLEKELGASTDRALPRYLTQHNRLERFLRARGYAYVLVPAGWDPTEYSAAADRIMKQSPGLDLVYELDRTELREVVRATTLLDRLVPPRRWSASHLLNAFDSLQAVPSDPRPTFAFAHFMLPHRPYRYQADCRRAPRWAWEAPSISPAAKAGYLGQVRCANRRVLETVTALIARSTPAPIIVIQADHGSRSTPDSVRTTADGFRTLARENLGGFGAYYLPDGGSARLTGTVTPVNVFRHILSYYFGADLPPVPDHSYLLAPDDTYRFTRADTALDVSLGTAR